MLERNVATERTLAIINRENSLVMVAPGRRVLELLGAVRPTDVALVEAMALDVAPVYDRLQPWNFSNGFLSRIPEHLVVTGAATLAGAIGHVRSDRAILQPSGWFHRGRGRVDAA